jgi:glycosyltransferase involved in cell wall biosynthesis
MAPVEYGQGGLGRHFTQVIEEVRSTGNLVGYFATTAKSDDRYGHTIRSRWTSAAIRFTPLRFSPSWIWLLSSIVFDRAVARRLPAAAILYGFDGMALTSFRAARRLGYRELHLEAAMSHIDNVIRKIDQAHVANPIEPSPINWKMAQRFRDECAEADTIWVTSEYSRQTFLAAGVPVDKLRNRVLRVPEQFRPIEDRPTPDGVFRVVYIGSLSLRKGIPVLIDAFHRLGGKAELTLVGGSGSRGMRNFMAKAMARDPRIRIAPGDPMPHLRRADVCVHPTYEDGFAYAPMEALACGVPVIVTEDTGMKEHVAEGKNGFVVPTGDWTALLERLEHLRRHPLSRFC